MHCSNVAAALEPLLANLMAAPFAPGIAGSNHNHHSALPQLLSDDATYLSRIASISPNRLHWESSPDHQRCPDSAALLATLATVLHAMHQIIARHRES